MLMLLLPDYWLSHKISNQLPESAGCKALLIAETVVSSFRDGVWILQRLQAGVAEIVLKLLAHYCSYGDLHQDQTACSVLRGG